MSVHVFNPAAPHVLGHKKPEMDESQLKWPLLVCINSLYWAAILPLSPVLLVKFSFVIKQQF